MIVKRFPNVLNAPPLLRSLFAVIRGRLNTVGKPQPDRLVLACGALPCHMLPSIVRTTGHRPIIGSKSKRVAAAARHKNIFVCKNKIGDELLDFVTAGPKLRKWYGAGERPVDVNEEQEPEEPVAASDVVLVTEADSPIGEQVVLQLILNRQQLRLLVRDVAAAKTAYGPYATPLPAGTGVSPRMLRGVKCLVLLGRPAKGLLEASQVARVAHVVLLSTAPTAASNGGGFSLLGGALSILGGGGGGAGAARELRELADTAAEAAVRASGLPYSVVQVYGLQDPGCAAGGGGGGVALFQQQQQQPGAANGGGGRAVSREALAALISGLVDVVPERGRTLQAAPSSEAAALSPSYSLERQQQALMAALQGVAEDA